MKNSPNHPVETNRCQASRLWSWQVIENSFPVCDRALSAAAAHLGSGALALGVFPPVPC